MSRRGRRSFGPVVLLGLASAGLAAVAGHKPVVRLDSGQLESLGMTNVGAMLDRVGVDDGLPLAGALALVVLAGWGVLLVTRGLVRRTVAGGLLVLSAGLMAATLVGWLRLRDSFGRDVVDRLGAGSHLPEELTAQTTPWLWVLLIAGVLATVAAGLAVVLVPGWPEMGARYDAPSAAAGSRKPLEERSTIDVWKSLDEGDDPTT